VKAEYQPVTDEADIPRLVGQMSARTVIIDVEPLIAGWDSGQDALDQGVARFVEQARTIDSVCVVCFATNSVRLPSTLPDAAGLRLEYLASARKPLRTSPYQGMPMPGVVIGDQVATDGLLAMRIGYTFLHYRPRPGSMPIGPLLLFRSGDLLRPALFRSTNNDS
jgi:predicted HAD superfamily phosphohydrolase YqeG